MSAKASLPDPASESAYAPTVPDGERGEPPALDVVAAEPQHRVDDQRVLDIDQHADRRVDPRQLFDRQHGMKEAAAGAAMGLGDLDPHHAEVEELVDERARNLGVLVHFAHEGPDLRLGKCPHAVAENRLVFLRER